MKRIAVIVVPLLVAAPAFAAETTLHGMYQGSAKDLRTRFSDAVIVHLRRHEGAVDAQGVGHASFGKDSPMTITLEVTDDTHFAITVSAPKRDTKDVTKWADELRRML
jgi:hypothetical protein